MHPHIHRPLALSLSMVVACGTGTDPDDDTNDTSDSGSLDGPESFPVLIDSQVLPAGDEACPSGGMRIRTGLDDGSGAGTARDNVLDDDEVTASTDVCDGQSGTLGEPGGNLLRYEPIPPGEEGCDDGGVRILVGQDDGTDGGVAGDAILQDGEVRSDSVVCADPDPFAFQPGPDAPGGPVGSATIDLSGGQGNSEARGGEGGTAYFELRQPTAGFLRAHTTGQVDTSFTMPTANPDFGADKVTVSSDRVVGTGSTSDLSEYVDGDLFIQGNSLYVVQGDSAQEVTGLEVASGATLEFDPGVDQVLQQAVIIGPGGVSLDFPRAVQIDGTVTMVEDAKGANLTLRASFVSVAGTVDVSAPDGGGNLILEATQGTGGSILVSGTLDARSTGDDGGGGDISLQARVNIYLDGTVQMDASSTDTNRGDRGGYLYLDANRNAYVGGTISARGGDGGGTGVVDGGEGISGITGDGGEGGGLEVYGERVVMGPNLNVRGGNGSVVCEAEGDCDGGEGGYVYVDASSRKGAAIGGSWELVGGTGQRDGDGGEGGIVEVSMSSDSSYYGPRVISTASAGARLAFGASIDARGGNAGPDAFRGGSGGELYLYADFEANRPGDLALYGVSQVRANGGDGTRGARAGSIFGAYGAGFSGSFGNQSAGTSGLSSIFPTGISWDVPVEATGGDGSESAGGEGGSMFLTSESIERRDFTMTADAQLNGGQGKYSGGQGGLLIAGTARGDATVQGVVDANGGDATDGAEGYGGYGGEVLFVAEGGDLTVDASAAVNGGDGAEGGGYGGRYGAEGGVVTWDGTCDATGGDATVEGDGGEGGGVFGFSELSATTFGLSSNVAGGLGAGDGEDGRDGAVVIDGVPR